MPLLCVQDTTGILFLSKMIKFLLTPARLNTCRQSHLFIVDGTSSENVVRIRLVVVNNIAKKRVVRPGVCLALWHNILKRTWTDFVFFLTIKFQNCVCDNKNSVRKYNNQNGNLSLAQQVHVPAGKTA